MIIKNGIVFHEDRTFSKDTLFLKNGRIVPQAETEDTDVLNAEGMYVLPGLVDVHSHGAAGHDFCDADAKGLEEILRYECSCGITSYCPTTMALPKEKLLNVFRTAAAVSENEKKGMARIAGIHMEGPFLSFQKRGAHAKEHIRLPDADFFRECEKAGGNLIRLVTVAPEMEGAMAFIREVCQSVTVSLGHTNADYDTAKAALQAGARHVTHLFNAMAPFAHREPGLIGAAAEDARCMAELICDGIHAHESAVRAAFRLFPDRIVLISDSMRATGLADGCYELGGQQVRVAGKKAQLSDGTIAGSVTNLYDCMCQVVKFGVPLEQAVAAATMHPARSIGAFDTIGSLAPGKRADILLVDRRMQLAAVIMDGKISDL